MWDHSAEHTEYFLTSKYMLVQTSRYLMYAALSMLMYFESAEGEKKKEKTNTVQY